MNRKDGKTMNGGIAIGKIRYVGWKEEEYSAKKILDAKEEIRRYQAACDEAALQLKELYEHALEIYEEGMENTEILQAQEMILQDEEYHKLVCDVIQKQRVNAEYAVSKAGAYYSDLFAGLDDEYMKARALDVKDVSKRICAVLCGNRKERSLGKESVIYMAENLMPSEILAMDREWVLGFILQEGSVNSHTAILARGMGVPAVFGIETEHDWNGKTVILDGNNGKVYIEPDSEMLAFYMEEKEREMVKKRSLESMRSEESVSRSGRKIELYANISGLEDLEAVRKNGAEGIGLFRTEFLCLKKEKIPSEEEQFQIYKKVLEGMNGKKVIIRTFDLGADKQQKGLQAAYSADYKNRGIEVLLSEPELFRTQLRALYRAGRYGDLGILYPMISSMEQIEKIKTFSSEVRKELQEEGIQLCDVEEGIMIETPEAAAQSDVLAKHVDFFSIGTNDLTQYALGIDRIYTDESKLTDSQRTELLDLIRLTVENGHKAGIKTGICGELSADPSLTEAFLEIGVDELSMSPERILEIRRTIREL